MSVLPPIASTSPPVQSSTRPVSTSEGQPVELRPEQMVRAIVVKGGTERALLEINFRQFRAQSDLTLQAGQKLTLQVLQTQPTIELRVINDPLAGRLNQLLPLMSQPYDWSRLLDVLQQRPLPPGLPQSTLQVYQQLQQLLQPNGQLPAAIVSELGTLPAQLKQLSLTLSSGQSNSELPGSVLTGKQGTVVYHTENTQQPNLLQLMRGLHGQLSQLESAAGRSLPQTWLAEISSIVTPLLQALPQIQLSQLQGNDLLALVGQLRQQSSLPAPLVGKLEQLLLQLKMQAGRALPPAGQSTLQKVVAQPLAQAAPVIQNRHNSPTQQANSAMSTTGLYRPAVAAGGSVPTPQPSAKSPAEISSGLERLLRQVQQNQGQAERLSPELLGRLEGLHDKLQQLPPTAQSGQSAIPGLELIASQLAQLIQQGVQPAKGRQLGLLSQLFGFNFEAKLLKGQKKDTLASLKLSLLALQKELGKEIDEPLRRLEMLQLCKAKLAEEQVQFLPLPFDELEEGYLLMEKPPPDEEQTTDRPLQLSLSLRLSALGNMQVDMLYEKQGLHLRIACEDKEKMAYLQNYTAELEAALETVALHTVSFSADGQVPARQLLERLLPEATSMLDARV